MVNARSKLLFGSWALPVLSLWQRDVRRFLRQRSRLVGALATPMVFWLFIGSGFGQSFQAPGAGQRDYLSYLFPGTLVLIVLFTAIFSTISVIEDRREGFLQGVLVAPVSRSAIVFGKVGGAASLALLQAGLMLLIAPLAGLPITPASVAATLAVLTILGVALGAVGLALAWCLDSTQGFHSIMNLLLVPMWILSGALFPSQGAATWIQWAVAANPLTYGVAALRRAMLVAQDAATESGPSLSTSLAVTMLFTLAALAVATIVVQRRN